MCISSPKVEAAPPPPKVESMDATNNIAASREADLRRRRQALSRMNTQAGGPMQGSDAGKAKLGG